MEAGMSKIKVMAYSVLGGGPIPALQMTMFLLCLHNKKQRQKALISSSYKGTNPILGAPPS